MLKYKKIPEIVRNKIDKSIRIGYGKPKCTLIWMHGLGDSAEGFFSYFTHLVSPVYQGIVVKILESPLKNITINNGERCNSWFDVLSYDRFINDEKQTVNFEDIRESQEIIDEHVRGEVKLWREMEPKSKVNPFHRVFVGGFSQGGVMALKYALESKVPPAGAICLSGYMLRSAEYRNFQKVPMLLMHGTHDPQIREIMARKSYEKLMRDENLVQYNVIEGLHHSVNLQQLDVIKNWIHERYKIIERVYEKQVIEKIEKQTKQQQKN